MQTHVLLFAAGLALLAFGCQDVASGSPCKDLACEHGSCTDHGAEATCVCEPGWSGATCSDDINECQRADACGADERCENTKGAYVCVDVDPIEPTCDEGYALVNGVCADVDECKDQPCGPHGLCANLPGNFACICLEGFDDSLSGLCEDIDECSYGVCGAHALCNNSVGSFGCVCDAGYAFDGAACVDVDECAGANDCGENSVCINVEGAYDCRCADGYSGDGRTCEDIDECDMGIGCRWGGGVCTNTSGSFTCACAPGWVPDGERCRDIDECAVAGVCGEHTTCTNTPGFRECKCKAGFAINGGVCTDIDECARPGRCAEQASCTNSAGSFACRCHDGYAGDGRSCVDIDECAVADACDANAICTNAPGSSTCACKPDFIGDGHACVAVSECDDGAPCREHAHCESHDATTSCVCDDGWDGDGRRCEVAPLVQLSAGFHRTAALRGDGSLFSWGAGDGPGYLAGKDFQQVVGECGLHSDGTVQCASERRLEGRFVRLLEQPEVRSRLCGVRADHSIACSDGESAQREIEAPELVAVVQSGWDLCGLSASGAATCWSWREPALRETLLGAYRGIVASHTGRFDSMVCLLGIDGHVLCRGSEPWHNPLPSERFEQLALLQDAGCGLRPDGSVACWGSRASMLTERARGESFVRLEATAEFVCGERADQSLHCWDGTDPGDGGGHPPYVYHLEPGAPFAQLAPGYDHLCVLREDGSIRCVGPNVYGEASVPPVGALARLLSTPGQYDGDGRGWEQPCAQLEDGRVSCFGGIATNLDTEPFTMLESCENGLCALRPDGSLVCLGAVARGAPADHERFVQIATGRVHVCALRANGTASCWGSNPWGQTEVPPGEVFSEIWTGRNRSYGLRRDGSAVVQWGDGGAAVYPVPGPYAQIYSPNGRWCGLLSDGAAHCPSRGDVPAPTNERFTALALGRAHTCGLRADGSVRCWGSNESGQLAAPAVERFVQIQAAEENTCGIRADDTVRCWGTDLTGGWGDVTPAGRFSALSIGSYHACGLTLAGAVTCWGDTSLQPQAHERFKDIQGDCGVRRDGSAVVCWGDKPRFFPTR